MFKIYILFSFQRNIRLRNRYINLRNKKTICGRVIKYGRFFGKKSLYEEITDNKENNGNVWYLWICWRRTKERGSEKVISNLTLVLGVLFFVLVIAIRIVD